MLRSQTVETDLNVSRSQRASVAATGIALASLPMLLKAPLAIVAPILCLMAMGWLNRDFYRFLARTRSAGFAFAAFPMHLVYFGCCGLSVAISDCGSRCCPGRCHRGNCPPCSGRNRDRPPLRCPRTSRSTRESIPHGPTAREGRRRQVRQPPRCGARRRLAALIADDLKACSRPHASYQAKPGVSHRRQLPSDPPRHAVGRDGFGVRGGCVAGHDRRGRDRCNCWFYAVRIPPRGRRQAGRLPRHQPRRERVGAFGTVGDGRHAADGSSLADARRKRMPGFAGSGQDARHVDRHTFAEEHAVLHPPSRPDHDARLQGRQRLHRLEAAGGRVPQGRLARGQRDDAGDGSAQEHEEPPDRKGPAGRFSKSPWPRGEGVPSLGRGDEPQPRGPIPLGQTARQRGRRVRGHAPRRAEARHAVAPRSRNRGHRRGGR